MAWMACSIGCSLVDVEVAVGAAAAASAAGAATEAGAAAAGGAVEGAAVESDMASNEYSEESSRDQEREFLPVDVATRFHCMMAEEGKTLSPSLYIFAGASTRKDAMQFRQSFVTSHSHHLRHHELTPCSSRRQRFLPSLSPFPSSSSSSAVLAAVLQPGPLIRRRHRHRRRRRRHEALSAAFWPVWTFSSSRGHDIGEDTAACANAKPSVSGRSP